MLNTQNILRAAALLGTCALAAAQQPCVVTPSQVHTIPALAGQGLEITKLRAGVVFTPGVNELLALHGTDLVLVRDAMSAPKLLVVANEVADFAVLPAIGGVSRVVVVGPEGLRISTVIDGGPDVGATLSFRTVLNASWEDVTMLDASLSGGLVHIVGAAGSQVRRGKYDQSAFSPMPSLAAGGQIQQLAIADAHSHVGLEVAVRLVEGARFFLEDSAIPYLSLLGSPGQYIRLDRIPRGANVRDSFGVWTRNTVTDEFVEVVDAQVSLVLYGGPFRLNDVSYGAVGITYQPTISTLETDLVMASQNNEIVALHGLPQAPASYPFWLDPTQFSIHSAQALLGDLDVNNLRVACADFDGDGDGDLALASNAADEPYFAFVRNDCTYADADAVVEPYVPDETPPTPPNSFTFMGFTEMGAYTQLEVRQPPIFNNVPPTHVRVRVFIREYFDDPLMLPEQQPVVSPEVWWETAPSMDLQVMANQPLLYSNAPHQALLNIPETLLPISLTSGLPLMTNQVIAYFEFVPLIKQNGVVVQRANATVWVGSLQVELLARLICVNEPDEFSEFFPCSSYTGEDGGQLITEMHRRKVIRPIPPTQVPQ